MRWGRPQRRTGERRRRPSVGSTTQPLRPDVLAKVKHPLERLRATPLRRTLSEQATFEQLMIRRVQTLSFTGASAFQLRYWLLVTLCVTSDSSATLTRWSPTQWLAHLSDPRSSRSARFCCAAVTLPSIFLLAVSRLCPSARGLSEPLSFICERHPASDCSFAF